MNAREEVEETVRRYIEASNKADSASIADSFSDDATFTIWGDMPVSGTAVGRKAILEEFLPAARTLFRPGTLHLHIDRMMVDGAHAVAEIQARGQSAAGEPYENAYCMVFEVRDGRIRTIREYMDTAYAKRVLYA